MDIMQKQSYVQRIVSEGANIQSRPHILQKGSSSSCSSVLKALDIQKY